MELRNNRAPLELTEVLVSLMQKSGQNWGFIVFGNGKIPESAAEYGQSCKFDNESQRPAFNSVLQEYQILKEEIQRQEYVYNRTAEYPSIEEQLDTIYHQGIDAWKQTIQAVKDKYPKPE